MGFPSGSGIKNPLPMQETRVQSLGWEDPLEKEMTTHFGIRSMGSKVGHDIVIKPPSIPRPKEPKHGKAIHRWNICTAGYLSHFRLCPCLQRYQRAMAPVPKSWEAWEKLCCTEGSL